MAVDMFIKIGDIKGESLDSKHKDEIEVLSFSWGISDVSKKPGTPGKLSPARKVAVQDFSIVKMMDSSSPVLIGKTCEGVHIPEVSVFVRRAVEGATDYLKIKLVDVIVSSVRPSGAAGGDATAMEAVSFSFATVDIAALNPQGNFEQVSCPMPADSFFDRQ